MPKSGDTKKVTPQTLGVEIGVKTHEVIYYLLQNKIFAHAGTPIDSETADKVRKHFSRADD